MNKIKLSILLFVFGLYGLNADVIPTGQHTVPRNIYIANCSEFPDYTLVGYITGPMIKGYQLYEIKENSPLTKGYKFNTFKVYALKTSFVNASGGITALDFNKITAVVQPCGILDPQPLIVIDGDPLSEEIVVYKIARVSGNKLVLYVAEHTLRFSNGHAPDTEKFQPPAN